MRYIYGILLIAICVLVLIWKGIIGISSSDSLPIEKRDYIQNNLLVSVDWMKKHLDDKDILIIDARGDEAYNKGHIKGAISTSWQFFSDMKALKGEGFTTLLNHKILSEKFQQLGIDDKKTIIVYADPNGWGEDGRIVWMLRMAGLSNTKILDGGWPLWEQSKGEISKIKESIKPSDFVISKINKDMLITTEEIVANRDDLAIIDTRSSAEWLGATIYGESRGGHIKDALHIEWSDLFNNDETIKTQKELESIMKEKGIFKDDKIVCYCTAGIRSAHMTLVLRMAGYKNAKNYAASMYEWSARTELPME